MPHGSLCGISMEVQSGGGCRRSNTIVMELYAGNIVVNGVKCPFQVNKYSASELPILCVGRNVVKICIAVNLYFAGLLREPY